MPSTFTGNTGIEKIADGEQSGLWGQTTNLNFDIVDRALNGSVDVVLSGTTHTLTTSDGVLSDGQFAVLTFTGSPSGTNTVTIAPNTAQKLYFVRNTTAQTVVLSQGSGANVSIPAGTSKVVFSNGAGAGATVFDFTNTLSGNLTGNASTATALQTARTIGGVSFNGTANINLPGVNVTGNQNTTGSAASLTTARTIGGVSFNGTANINLPGVNQAGNQNTSGNAATATTATNLSRSVIAGTGLTGGGQLDDDRTFAVDSTVVRTSRTISTGTGLTGGGNLSANRTFAIDIATTAEAGAGTSNTKVITPLRIRNAFNATGAAPVYACRAWVNFNGTGTVAIRASGNVSSVTRNGTGQYTVNFTTAISDTNYAVVCSGGNNAPSLRVVSPDQVSRVTTSNRILVADVTGTFTNIASVNFAVFR